MPDHIISISEPTLRRLPLYYQLLVAENEKGVEHISCPKIADSLELTTIQVRKDLQAAGAQGKPRIGYVIEEVLETLSDLLGYNNTKDALLVGVGNLGQALLGYENFQDHGLNIVAAFDVDEKKIGRVFYGKRVYPLDQFSHIAKRLNIQIGIITTPSNVADKIADLMDKSDIKAIWNFTQKHINVSEGIVVEDVNLTASFSVLSNKLKKNIESRG
jgi:redox-sensing transcriptional repressor